MKFLLAFFFLFSQLANGELYNPPTSTPTAYRYAGWDTSLNFSANNHLAGYATIATAAGTTTLSVTSAQQEYFTGSTTQTVTLPVASTLVLGFSFNITNLSSGVVTVNSSGANLVQAMAANTQAVYTCILASGTSAASWNVVYYPIGTVPIAVGGTGQTTKAAGFDALSPMTTAGDIIYGGTSGTGTRLAVGTAGQALLVSSDTTKVVWGNVLTNPMTTGGDIIYGGASGVATRLANGTAGQFLRSAGSTSAPTWSSTLVAATSSGDLTMSNGGIAFPATQSVSAGANTLDDYEEGTWTPSWTLTSGSVTYANQNGIYTKIGNTVIVGCWIRLASITTPTNANLVLAGLPFAANAGEYRYAAFMRSNLSTATGQVVGFLSGSQTTLTMVAINNGASTAISALTYLSNANSEADFFLVYQAAN